MLENPYKIRLDLINIIQKIPDNKLEGAIEYMLSLVDDIEPPLTEEEKKESQENYKAILAGDYVALEEVYK